MCSIISIKVVTKANSLFTFWFKSFILIPSSWPMMSTALLLGTIFFPSKISTCDWVVSCACAVIMSTQIPGATDPEPDMFGRVRSLRTSSDGMAKLILLLCGSTWPLLVVLDVMVPECLNPRMKRISLPPEGLRITGPPEGLRVMLVSHTAGVLTPIVFNTIC